MADFFEKLMEDAKKTAAKVASRTVATANIAKNKTLETVDNVKLEIEIKKAQSNLEKEYQVLGQISYSIEKGLLNRDDEILQASCKRIDQCMKQIEELEEKKYGKKENADSKEEPEKADDNEEFHGYKTDADGYPLMKFCPHCKTGNPADATVCVHCHKEI